MDEELQLNEERNNYLAVAFPILSKIMGTDVYMQSLSWLMKLSTATCNGIQNRRCRNNYILRLIICMQFGKLEAAFLLKGDDINILMDATKNVESAPEEGKQPVSLEDCFNFHSERPQGVDRRYVATGEFKESVPQLWIGSGERAKYMSLLSTPPSAINPSAIHSKTCGTQVEEEQLADQVPIYKRERLLTKCKDPAKIKRKDPTELKRIDRLGESLAVGVGCNRVEKIEKINTMFVNGCLFEQNQLFMESQRSYDKMMIQLNKTTNKTKEMLRIMNDNPTDDISAVIQGVQSTSNRVMGMCKEVTERYVLVTEAGEKNREKLEIPVDGHTNQDETSKNPDFGTQKLAKVDAKTLYLETQEVSTQTEQMTKKDANKLMEKSKLAVSMLLKNIEQLTSGLSNVIELYENNVDYIETAFYS